MDHLDSWDDETVQDAVDILQDLVLWKISPQRWERVEEILRLIEVALAAGDGEGLRHAVIELEITGPVRIQRIGSKEETKIPQPVFERRNMLVHALTNERRGASKEESDSRQPR